MKFLSSFRCCSADSTDPTPPTHADAEPAHANTKPAIVQSFNNSDSIPVVAAAAFTHMSFPPPHEAEFKVQSEGSRFPSFSSVVIIDDEAPIRHGISQGDQALIRPGCLGIRDRLTFKQPEESETSEKERDLLAISLNFQNRPGRHTVKSPVVGARAEELLAVKKAMRVEPVLANLQKSIYNKTFIYLIPITKKDQADEIARELFLNYISKYAIHGCTEQNIVD